MGSHLTLINISWNNGVVDSDTNSTSWTVPIASSGEHYSGCRRRGVDGTERLAVEPLKATDFPQGACIVTSPVKKLHVVRSTWRASVDTKCSPVNGELNCGIAVWELDDPFALEVVLSVAIGPSLRLETATGSSEYASTSTRAPIGLQKVPIFAGTSVRAIYVSTYMSTAISLFCTLVDFITLSSIGQSVATSAPTLKRAIFIDTLVIAPSVVHTALINV
jgi:hypothetical protein